MAEAVNPQEQGDIDYDQDVDVDEDVDEDDDDDDDDIDAEAEEIARRLGEELLADLTKANAGRAPSPTSIPIPSLSNSGLTSAATPSTRKSDAAIATVKAILSLIENDDLARSSLASTVIPNFSGGNLLHTLNQIVASGNVTKALALPLSHVLISLARSHVLFGDLRNSNASSIQLDKGKRKRDEVDDQHVPRPFKRPYVLLSDLQTQVSEAVHVITNALRSSPTQLLDPTLVSSIRLQLHQIFLFAVTSSAAGGRDMHALQEISGLIQVIGVLSGIQIGQPGTHPEHFPLNSTYAWPIPPTDIGTAVYPCLVAECKKTFSRLYHLRSHQRLHAVHRPFRCNTCPASFARNHDLKRHVKLHEKKAWRCGGCLKVFSRRDAIKRHKNGSKTRGPKGELCLNAEVVEVELDDEDGEESLREERRAKLWNGITTSQGNASGSLLSSSARQDGQIEEGEIQPAIISEIQSAVMSLHGPLQAHVGKALGTPTAQVVPLDPTAGQATLASVIARAQMQNISTSLDPSPDSDMNLSNVASHIHLDTHLAKDQHCQDLPSQYDPEPVKCSETELSTATSLSMYGLSDEQTRMLEEAIASAAAAAQAQAEAEAALEEEEDEDDDDDGEEHPNLR